MQMSLQRQYEEHIERERRVLDYERAETEREAHEERAALEMAFSERAGCVAACFDACTHTAACLAAPAITAVIAEPVRVAIAGWLASQPASQRLSVGAVTRICRAEAA
jgi:hypothetical protein